jgi:hypothetical protein
MRVRLKKSVLLVAILVLEYTKPLPSFAEEVIPVGTKIPIELKSDLDSESAVGVKRLSRQ